MASQRLFNVAVVGATGAVGVQIVRLLEQRNFPLQELRLLASSRSAGNKVSFKDQELVVQETKEDSFKGIDIALFSAGGEYSKKFVPHAVESGAICIDNTSAYRMDPAVPLVVPEVNSEQIRQHQGVIANPNCSTIQMAVTLKPLYDHYGVSRIIVSTYQAVSGAGHQAVVEMLRQAEKSLRGEPVEPALLPVSSLPVKHQIAFNAIPQIDKFEQNDFTFEEMKMVNETKKIIGDDTLQVAATCVRIPVVQGHSESVYMELNSDFEMEEVKKLLNEQPGLLVVDDPAQQQYPMPLDAEGKNEVFVGRLRRDLDHPRGLHMWIVSDNLLKGAAWNAVQIAETIAYGRTDADS